MPDLTHSLQGHDPGYLKIVAELWDVQIDLQDVRQAPARLAAQLLIPARIKNTILSLPSEARKALADLAYSQGRIPWPLFTRRYGEVREMGAGRRDRDLPQFSPASAAEFLWYRSLISRSFFDTNEGPVEFAYIPDDLLPHLKLQARKPLSPPGRPASHSERANQLLASDVILDHTCTLLAALRLGLSEEAVDKAASSWKELNPRQPYSITRSALVSLLKAAGLIDDALLPGSESVREFLETTRGDALAWLCRSWIQAQDFNELRINPHLKPEGEWKNDPLHARRAVLGYLEKINPDTWWSLPEFISAIHHEDPDFQRPAGDYDSWFIREVRADGEGEFLRGFEHWDSVDGEVIRFIICGPMHWLGLIDLAWGKVANPGHPTAFRLSKWSQALLTGTAPPGLSIEDKPLTAGSDGRIRIPRLASRAARYQLARFCSWEDETEAYYPYRLTPSSLARARMQGLNVQQLIILLRRHVPALPPGLIKALERWEKRGVEARFEKLVILRLSSPEILQSLRSTRAARFLGDPLGPTAVIVRAGALERVLGALAEMGFLGEANLEE
jgi:hypothetical protein